MFKAINCFILLAVVFCGCGGSDIPQVTEYHLIAARDERVIYRVRVPEGWEYRLPEGAMYLTDTKLPLGEVFIREGDQEIRITIHNFPSREIEDRVPPMAQISRWRRQIDDLESENVTPQSFSGYVGFLFEGRGTEKSVMGWTLRIGNEHYYRLKTPNLRGDVTIKATGPNAMIEKHRKDIIAFARTFELIEEIPSP